MCVWEVVVKPLMVNLYHILILLDGLTFENRWRCGVMAWNERMANCRSSERRMRGLDLSGHACMAVQEMGAGVQLRPVSDLVFHKAWDLQQCGGGHRSDVDGSSTYKNDKKTSFRYSKKNQTLPAWLHMAPLSIPSSSLVPILPILPILCCLLTI